MEETIDKKARAMIEQVYSMLDTRITTMNDRTKLLTIKDRERKNEIKELNKRIKTLEEK